VIDVYTTDAQIARLKLRVLTDDRRYFPRYDAVILYRLDLPQRHPQAWVALQALAGRIDEAAMREMNGRAEIDSVPFASIAAGFVAGAGAWGARCGRGRGGGDSNAAAATPDAAAATPNAPAGTGRAGFLDRLLADDFARLAWEHLRLVLTSVLIAVLIGVPLGVIASSSPTLERIVLAVTGIAQTIPSLALLAMLIPLVGRIGTLPALIALVTYALLPIVRNTCVGLAGVAPGLRARPWPSA
jgi:osmoprotectant transport system permease protein